MIEIANTTKTKTPERGMILLAEAFLKSFKSFKKDVSIAIVGDTRMKTLNSIYRGYNKTTDVLSFNTDNLDNLLGEIIINPQEIKRLSKYKEILEFVGASYPPKNLKKTQEYLFYFILVHGLLHLVGYNDEREKDRLEMLRLGLKFLTKHGIIIK